MNLHAYNPPYNAYDYVISYNQDETYRVTSRIGRDVHEIC